MSISCYASPSVCRCTFTDLSSLCYDKKSLVVENSNLTSFELSLPSPWVSPRASTAENERKRVQPGSLIIIEHVICLFSLVTNWLIFGENLLAASILIWKLGFYKAYRWTLLYDVVYRKVQSWTSQWQMAVHHWSKQWRATTCRWLTPCWVQTRIRIFRTRTVSCIRWLNSISERTEVCLCIASCGLRDCKNRFLVYMHLMSEIQLLPCLLLFTSKARFTLSHWSNIFSGACSICSYSV